MTKNLPNAQILRELLEKYTQKELADKFGVNEKTIRRHLKLSDKPKQKRGRKEIFSPEVLYVLAHYTVYLETTTQKSLARDFSRWMKRTISQPTICRALKKAGIAYKKISYQALEQLRKKNQEKINHFINITLPSLLQSDANIFFLDETGFHLNMSPRRGYYWKSSRLVCQRPGDKGKNHTLMFLTQISDDTEKIIHWKLIEGGMKTKDFHEYLTNFNPPNNGKKNVLIMDNLRVHKATDACKKLKLSTIKELLDSKDMEVIFLPSYTPELNPVEPINSILKQHVEKIQARERDELELAIKEKVEGFFQKENLTKYLDNSIKECLMKNNKVFQERLSLKPWKPLFYWEFDPITGKATKADILN